MTVNLGGVHVNVQAAGVDEALKKLDQLNEALEKANSLIKELAAHEVQFKVRQDGQESE